MNLFSFVWYRKNASCGEHDQGKKDGQWSWWRADFLMLISSFSMFFHFFFFSCRRFFPFVFQTLSLFPGSTDHCSFFLLANTRYAVSTVVKFWRLRDTPRKLLTNQAATVSFNFIQKERRNSSSQTIKFLAGLSPMSSTWCIWLFLDFRIILCLDRIRKITRYKCSSFWFEFIGSINHGDFPWLSFINKVGARE